MKKFFMAVVIYAAEAPLRPGNLELLLENDLDIVLVGHPRKEVYGSIVEKGIEGCDASERTENPVIDVPETKITVIQRWQTESSQTMFASLDEAAQEAFDLLANSAGREIAEFLSANSVESVLRNATDLGFTVDQKIAGIRVYNRWLARKGLTCDIAIEVPYHWVNPYDVDAE